MFLSTYYVSFKKHQVGQDGLRIEAEESHGLGVYRSSRDLKNNERAMFTLASSQAPSHAAAAEAAKYQVL